MAAAVFAGDDHSNFEATGVKSDCHSLVELRFSARGLRKLDTFSNTDAFAVVYVDDQEIGRTEVVDDTQNPEWSKQFMLDYFFEEVQCVVVRVYDEDVKNSRKLSDHQFAGEVRFALADLMATHGQSLVRPLIKPHKTRNDNRGELVITGEELASCSEYLRFQLRGVGLVNKDGWGLTRLINKSDPFFVIKRAREDGQWVQVYKSVTIDDNLNPRWPEDTVSLQALCNADYDRPLRIELWDEESDGNHDAMGYTETSVRMILDKADMPVVEVKKSGKKKPAGTLKVVSATSYRQNTFLDYIRSGWELNMVVAIDFTGSNGNPAMPDTLHYIDPQGRLNPYQKTISGLAQVLEQYDSDKLLPCYGFGARGGPDRRISHCFPLNGDPTNPYVHGQEGVLSAYRSALTQWGLSGPTIFSQVINAAVSMASRHQDQNKPAYTILLIITDGVINDMQQTKSAIVAASNLPMSIIIVGVGDADFTDMIELDADDGPLIDASGKRAHRDMVQFVRFNDFARAAPGRLEKETLIELPHQMMGYFKAHNIHPAVVTDAHVSHEVTAERAYDGAAAEATVVAQPVVLTEDERRLSNVGKTLLAQRM